MKQQSIFSDLYSDDSVVKQIDKIQWRLSVDGASRGNPGPSGAGIVLYKGDVLLIKQGFFLGSKTNNQAEYLAVILGLFILHEYIQPDDSVTIVSDSQLLVRQLQGMYRVKMPHLQPLYNCAKKMIGQHDSLIIHVMREDNVLADKMANSGVDEKQLLPKKYIDLLRQYNITI